MLPNPIPFLRECMRYLLMFKSTAFSEAGVKYDQDFAASRTAYTKSLANAEILLADESLLPSSSGLRITFPPDRFLRRVA